MSALSALASYDVSDDEGGDENNESVNEEKEQAIERKVTPAQDKELTGDKTIPTVTNNLDEEDIWRNSDEEEFRETEVHSQNF